MSLIRFMNMMRDERMRDVVPDTRAFALIQESIKGGIPKGQLMALAAGWRGMGPPKTDYLGYTLRHHLLTSPPSRSWQIARAVEIIHSPRPMPTHYVTEMDMSRHGPTVRKGKMDLSEAYGTIMGRINYESYIVIDSLGFLHDLKKSEIQEKSTDPWDRYRPWKSYYKK